MATTPGSRCLSDAQLRALYSQTMPAAEAEQAQAHLAECSSCWARYAALDPDLSSADTQTATPSVMQSSSGFFGRPPKLEGYEIIQELGRGGQAIVYQALQVSTRRTVAIKVAPRRVLDHAQERSRFQREIEVLAQLNHPGIVTIHVSGESNDICYFVMDHVSGVPLDEYTRRTDHSVTDRIRLFIKVCDAVNAAHLLGIVHRDIKPGNILVDQEDEPHLLDFGLAKLTLGAHDPAEMTLTGDFLGTPKWTSPEQAERHPGRVDLRTDVYSLGVVLYQLLTGDFPYGLEGSLSQVEHNIIHAEPQRPSRKNRKLDDELDKIVLKCLRKEREGRYANAGELARDLRRYLAGEAVEAKSPSLVYKVRTRTRKAVSKSPLVSCAFVVLLSTFVGHALAYIVHSNRLGGIIERTMTATRPSPFASGAFDHVRIVALDFSADVAAIAASQDLQDVSRREWTSLRRLHGRLLEKLAGSECRAVVVDISFPGETPYDEDFARGVRALKAAGVDVVVGIERWQPKEGIPEVSPVLAPEVSLGCTAAGLGANAPWNLVIVARRGLTDPRPSLALAAAAAVRHPGARYDIELDLREQTAALEYWKPDPAMPHSKHWLEITDRMPLLALRLASADGGHISPVYTRYGLGAGDSVGLYLLNVPPNEVLNASTVKYEKVLVADSKQLREWFRDKAVIVAVVNHPKDMHDHPDGRKLSGCYAQASGLSDLLRQVFVRKPRVVGEWTIPLAGAVLGAMVALAAPGAWRRRLAGLTAIVTILVITVLAFRELGYLCNPVFPLGGFLAAYIGCGTIRRLRAVHQN